ncbi:hypothetical protein [Streptomyces sp. YS-3]|uniref:hypothetical protein n=1 Tax=Streptomyces sp. YS-3 TaxID=3381352 RepID=UPI0038624276
MAGSEGTMSTPQMWPRPPRAAEPASPPQEAAVLRNYSPYEVVAINLWVGDHQYRTVAMAHYDTPEGRRAYHQCLWPALPDGALTGSYWWNPATMTRRDFTP